MTDNETMKRVTELAVNHYGNGHQITKCIEEVGEFLQALGRYNIAEEGEPALLAKGNLQEEIADAIIMLQQMRLIYGQEEIDWWINFKLERLEDRIEKEKKSV